MNAFRRNTKSGFLAAAAITLALTAAGDANARRNFNFEPTPDQIAKVRGGKHVNLGQGYFLGSANLVFGVQKDVRGYASVGQEGDALLFKQTSANFYIEGKAGYDTCKQKDMFPFKDPITKVVGMPQQGDGSVDNEFSGESKLKLTRRGGVVMAQVYVNAPSSQLKSNKYHLTENYQFEVAFTQGDWNGLVNGQPVKLEPTAAGLQQYQAELQKTVLHIGTRTAGELVEPALTWMMVSIRENLGGFTSFRLIEKPVIEGTRADLSFKIASPARGKAAYEASYFAPMILLLGSGEDRGSCNNL